MSDYDVHRDENLRRQVNDAYRPIDLFDSEKDRFFCPKCKKQLSISSARTVENKFSKSLVQTSCAECRERLYFKLPEIKKKRVYLDQSILGELFNVEVLSTFRIESADWRERLLTKIKLAKRLQKASFIISDIHVLETVPLPNQTKKAALWQFTNALADGNIAGDMSDAFEFELHRLLDGTSLKKTKSPLNCYMNVEIDRWSIRSPILLTNSWRLRLNHNWIEFKKASHENFTQILESQKMLVGENATLVQCILFLTNLYMNDVVNGIEYCQILTNKQQNFSELPTKNAYSSLIFQATQSYQDGSAQLVALNKLNQQINLHGINAFPSMRMQAILEAEVLFRWIQGIRANPKRFNENYGVSKMMDITHLAVFLPTVDVLTLDRDTFNRCQQIEIKSEIGKHSTKLLRATENERSLENWLDALLTEPETDEFRCTRRLFFGRNLAEEKYHDDQFISEILDRLEREKPTPA
jgi:hypothetical protein